MFARFSRDPAPHDGVLLLAHEALRAAEAFIEGFLDDPMQEDLDLLLLKVKAARAATQDHAGEQTA